MSSAPNHLSAGLCTPSALLSARTTQGMVWGMALADFRTLIADLGTELTEGIEPSGVPAHPTGAENTNVATVAAKARTLCHELVTMMLCHADHVIRAGFAGLGASETGLDAVSLLLRQWAGLHDSISLAEVVDEKMF